MDTHFCNSHFYKLSRKCHIFLELRGVNKLYHCNYFRVYYLPYQDKSDQNLWTNGVQCHHAMQANKQNPRFSSKSSPIQANLRSANNNLGIILKLFEYFLRKYKNLKKSNQRLCSPFVVDGHLCGSSHRDFETTVHGVHAIDYKLFVWKVNTGSTQTITLQNAVLIMW